MTRATMRATRASRRCRTHAGQLQQVGRIIDRARRLPRPLGDAQQPVRDAERQARRHVVALVRASGSPQAAVVQSLGVAAQTVSDWMGRWPRDRLEPHPRGRPPTCVHPVRTIEVRTVLDELGPAPGVPALKGLFPDVPRSNLRQLRQEYLADDRTARDGARACLLWTTPGIVWSADFTRPPMAIDDQFARILLVRDLASRCTLLAQPCLSESAAVLVPALTTLFAEHSPPLVLKTDNGSPFIAQETAHLFADRRVQNLLSPPLTPQYNGSVEASGGALKAHAAQIARQHGRAQCWSCDDIEAARLAANAFNRPWGLFAPTPDQAWQQRPPITEQQRIDLAAAVAANHEQMLASFAEHDDNNRPAPRGSIPAAAALTVPLTAAQRATVARTAIRQALVGLGYLQIRRPQDMSTKTKHDSSGN